MRPSSPVIYPREIVTGKRKLNYKLVASIHDEYQFDVCKEHAEELGTVTGLAMKLTEKSLGVRCPLDSEYKLGKTWAETH